ncbi:MAG: HAD family hydrolase [Candidatus Bathyarchaeia archaeon]|jgi:putative hydrolase of the HAD superfamily
MVCVKAVIFDYVGTLVNCRNYTMEASREKLHTALVNEGFDVAKDKFLEAYILAHEKYRKKRYEQLREVTNAVWVAEALCNIGFNATADDYRIKAALNVFFKDYLDMLELRAGAKKLIKQVKEQYKVALISNFTHSQVIYSSLRKLRINTFFNAVVISEENGWRKPSTHIFQATLNKLQVQANQAVYIGDSPIEDIKGAKQAGLKTVFVPSQFNTLKDLLDSLQKPDFIAKDLQSISENLTEIISIKQNKAIKNKEKES